MFSAGLLRMSVAPENILSVPVGFSSELLLFKGDYSPCRFDSESAYSTKLKSSC